MNRVGSEFSMSDQVTTPLVCDNFPWFTPMFLNESLEKSHSCYAISPGLQKHINNFTILVYSAPEIVLLSTNLDEDFINEECITESLMLAP
jgi:hypothetical protein